jgi:hypothetical protein
MMADKSLGFTHIPVMVLQSSATFSKTEAIVLYCLHVDNDRRAKLRFFRAFSSVVRQMPGYNSQRQGTAQTSQIFFLYCYVCGLGSSVGIETGYGLDGPGIKSR